MKQPPLAAKDASLFRQVLKNYETKQYKKGLKAAEQILRKNPKHGETIAMKGLIINCLGRAEEAFTLAKEALKHDMQSHVCWHVYGLLWRSVKNYDEAVKAYKFALKFDPESQQILRDLAYLQIQMREYSGYIESRRLILVGRPQIRQNWTALAIAYHLAGNYAEAENILTKYEQTLKQQPPKGDVEHSEASLYKNMVIAESGDTERALSHLESISKSALDKVAILERRADLLLKLQRWDEAEKAYRVLLERNADKRAYFEGLEKAIARGETISGTARSKFRGIYDEYAEKFPKSDAARRMPLDFFGGEEFRAAADLYLQRLLKKGVPSTFANIKALYEDPFKRQVIPELVENFLASQRQDKSDEANGESSKGLIWTLYFLAQHYDHYRTRDSEKALKFINEAIEQSNTTVEFYMTLARIHKHMGDLKTAMEHMNHAREIDLKDRFINTKTAKYQLRSDCNEAALKTMSLFTRNEANGGPLGDLLEMQCLWYITEDAESCLRQKKLGLALKRYHSIYKIFEDWTEDQFDFHSFSLRKGQIRAYVDMMRWEDTLRSHPFFSRAAIGAIKAYLLLADKPHLAHGFNGGEGDLDFEKLSLADRKKALKKARKDAQKQHEKEAAEKAAKKDKEKSSGDADKKEDDDPKGDKLAQTKDPLEDAMKFLNPLLEFSPLLLEPQILGFEIYLRRQKYLLALKCLLAAAKISPEHPDVHQAIIRFKKAIDALKEPLPGLVSEITTSEFLNLLPKGTDLISYNEEYLNKYKAGPKHIRGALRAMHFLQPNSLPRIESEVFESLKTGVEAGSDESGIPRFTLEDAYDGLSLLKEVNSRQSKIDEYREAVKRQFPHASRL